MAFILFEFGALMGGNRIFQCKRVQAEFIAEARYGVAVRRVQLNPDKAVRPPDMVADVAKRNGLKLVVAKKLAVDDGPPATR